MRAQSAKPGGTAVKVVFIVPGAENLLPGRFFIPAGLRDRGGALFVTPKDVDAQVRDVAKVVGYAINLALQPSLTAADLEALLN